MAGCGVADGIVGANADTIEAVDTPGAVDDEVGEVDAGAFADVLTFATTVAEVGVDVEAEERAGGDVAEESADGAESVAEETSPAEGEDDGDNRGGDAGEEC